MPQVSIAELPDELSSRVLAATGEPGHLVIHRGGGQPDEADEHYLVEAITGDRVSVMRLSFRSDGSVSETTDSFLVGEVFAVITHQDRAELGVGSLRDQRTVPVTPETATAVDNARPAGFF